MKNIFGISNKDKGFTLVEVIIAMLILSIIASAALLSFTYSIQMSRENQYGMTAINLANNRIEYIRSLDFANIGTKIVNGATTIYGDPKGEILQTETAMVDNVSYVIRTTINWEDESGWDLSDLDWDYKSIRVEVVPQITGKEEKLTKVINTLVTRDFSQPILTGANIGLRVIRGWKENPTAVVPVVNAKVALVAGPDAPKQIQTSASGVARFLDLHAGTYDILVDTSSAGMILQPDLSNNWTADIAEGITATKELEAEYPSYLNITLKSLEGYPISLNNSETGTIQIDVPYGTDINKNFQAADVSEQGNLPQSFIGKLWPVGTGYSGVYSITSIGLKNKTYFGAYESVGGVEELWSGTFTGPGTVKNIICYFGVIPESPSNNYDNWVDGSGNILTGVGALTANKVVFKTGDTTETIVVPAGSTSNFNAQQMYFENKGSSTSPGLLVNNHSNLSLNAGSIIFRGNVEFNSAVPNDQGKITLSTILNDGNTAPHVSGIDIGGLAFPDKMYGKVYFEEPLTVDGMDTISSGSYYFYDGLVLPDNASELIPITKDNFVGS